MSRCISVERPSFLMPSRFFSVPGRTGQHGIFRRQPTHSRVFQKGHGPLLQQGGAQHPGFSPVDEHGASFGFGKIRYQLHGPQFCRPSAVKALEILHLSPAFRASALFFLILTRQREIVYSGKRTARKPSGFGEGGRCALAKPKTAGPACWARWGGVPPLAAPPPPSMRRPAILHQSPRFAHIFPYRKSRRSFRTGGFVPCLFSPAAHALGAAAGAAVRRGRRVALGGSVSSSLGAVSSSGAWISRGAAVLLITSALI